jgi:hypothetical protein
MAGVIVVLAVLLVLNTGPGSAYATSYYQAVDSQGGLVAVPASTQQSINDLLWVVYKRAGAQAPGAAPDQGGGSDKTYLALYKAQGTMSPKIKLLAAREIDYDLRLVQYNNESPSVKDIHKELKEAEADRNKDKKP